MDQPPPHPPQLNTEGILGWALALVATLSALIVRGKFRLKTMREKVEGEAAPSIQKENIEWSEGIIQNWRDEIAAIRKETREEIAQERARADRERDRADEERRMREEWKEQAMECKNRVPYLEKQIEQLLKRVAELEKQVAERGPRHAD